MNHPLKATLATATTEELHGCDFVSRNIRVNGRRTSIRLEHALWQAFGDIAARENLTTRALCTLIDSQRRGSNLTAAVRLFIIGYFRIAMTREDKTPTQLRIVASSHGDNPSAEPTAESKAEPAGSLINLALSAIA